METETMFLVGVLASAIALVVFLIMRAHLHAFVSLVLVCFYVGFVTGMNPVAILTSIEAGMGGTLGFLATVLGFGSILGKMLETSGGAERLAKTLIARFGRQRAHWAMMIVGLVTGIPVFFQVGFVLLIPLVISVARATGMSIVRIGVPIGISLQVVHCMLPPHPAAMAITQVLGADVGKVILLGALVCTVCAAVGGPIFTRFVHANIASELDKTHQKTRQTLPKILPGFGITLFTVLLPMILMVGKTIFELSPWHGSMVGTWVNFLGSPIPALLLSAFFAYGSLGIARGKTMKELLTYTGQSFGPVAGILLVIGAGGAFNRVLIDSGLGARLGEILASLSISPLLLAWLVAAIMRFAVGSATVSMMTSAGIVLPLLADYPQLDPAIVCLAVGSGAICFSHVTDSGFWIVKEYFGLTVEGALKSYTAATCLASLTAISLTMLLSWVLI